MDYTKTMESGSNQTLNYTDVFRALPVYEIVLDRDFKIVDCTDAYLSISLTSRESILGFNVLEAFPEDPNNPSVLGAKKYGKSLRQVLETKQTQSMGIVRYDIRLPADEGGQFVERWWRLKNVPVLGNDGQVTAIVTHVDDINDVLDILEAAEDTHNFIKRELKDGQSVLAS